MRPYEVMVVFQSDLDEPKITAIVDRMVDIIKSGGGNLGQVSHWGKRRLAYEINHRSEGYYVLIETSAEPAAMAEVDRNLLIADEVIRHKVIRLPEGIKGRSTAASPDAAATTSKTGA